jgi:O-antigen/teichoic acid export membrane protein
MSMLKKLAGQTALYGLSSMIGRALNFLLVPFYTAVLQVGEFGIFTELYAYVAFFNVVYLFGMETTYFRFANKEGANEQEVYHQTQTFITLLSVLLSGTLIFMAQPIANSLGYTQNSHYIVWLALIMGIDAVVAIPFARLRMQGKAGYFAFAKIVNISLNIGFNLFFLVFCKAAYDGTFQGNGILEWVAGIYNPDRVVEYIFISNFLANASMLLLLWKHFAGFRFRWNPQMMKPMLVYAYPLMFMGLAGMVNEVLDRILLKPFLPDSFYPGITKEEALGIYGGCYKLSMFMTLAIQSFRYAADPFFFSKASDKKAPALFAHVMTWFVVVCTTIFLVVSLFSEEIASIVLRNPMYRQGLMIVPVLLLANLFLGMYYNLSIWYKLSDRTYFGTWTAVGGAFITVLMNILLIPLLGYLGSAVATLICYAAMAVASAAWGQKYYPIPYNWSVILAVIGAAVVIVYTTASFVPELDGWLWMGIKALLVLVFIGVVGVFLKKKQKIA